MSLKSTKHKQKDERPPPMSHHLLAWNERTWLPLSALASNHSHRGQGEVPRERKRETWAGFRTSREIPGRFVLP